MPSYRIWTQQCGEEWQCWNSWSADPRPPTGRGETEIDCVVDLLKKLQGFKELNPKNLPKDSSLLK